MSAKNVKGKSREFDAYYTPLSLAIEMCRLFEKENQDSAPWTVLEPSAGNGVFFRAMNHQEWDRTEGVGIEIRDEPRPFIVNDNFTWKNKTDFLECPWLVRYDLCIGNPPYTLAEEFVRRAIGCSDNVMFLLRLGFASSKRRGDLFFYHRPKNFWVLEQRPSFTRGGSDSADYGIFHWQKGWHGDTRMRWLRGGPWK